MKSLMMLKKILILLVQLFYKIWASGLSLLYRLSTNIWYEMKLTNFQSPLLSCSVELRMLVCIASIFSKFSGKILKKIQKRRFPPKYKFCFSKPSSFVIFPKKLKLVPASPNFVISRKNQKYVFCVGSLLFFSKKYKLNKK